MQQLGTHLVLFQPFFQQLLATLLKNRPAKLQRLKLVELALIQQDPEVLEQRRGLARLGRNALETADGVGGAQDTLDDTQTQEANESRVCSSPRTCAAATLKCTSKPFQKKQTARGVYRHA